MYTPADYSRHGNPKSYNVITIECAQEKDEQHGDLSNSKCYVVGQIGKELRNSGIIK